MPWTDYAADKFANEGLEGVDGASWENAYEIANAEQLALLAKRVNNNEAASDGIAYNTKYYKLIHDIFLAQHDWTPIGKTSPYFVGNFDGQGHTIFGLYASDYGFFAAVCGSTIKNFKLQNGFIVGGETSTAYAGSLINFVLPGAATNIENVSSNVVVKREDYVGGLVGSVRFSSSGGGGGSAQFTTCNISNCSYTGYVFGNINVGGIIGSAMRSITTLSDCTTNCYVSGTQVVGALVGNNNVNRGTISNCVAKGTIDGPGNIIVGSSNGTVTACSFYGSSTDDTLTLPPDATACWAVVNERKLISTPLDDPSWTENWVVVPELNNGLPMQKGLFWIGSDITTPVDKIKEALNGFEVEVA